MVLPAEIRDTPKDQTKKIFSAAISQELAQEILRRIDLRTRQAWLFRAAERLKMLSFSFSAVLGKATLFDDADVHHGCDAQELGDPDPQRHRSTTVGEKNV